MDAVEELTALAVSLYREENGLKVIEGGGIATNDLLLLYRRLDGGNWQGREVLSWAKQVLKTQFAHRRYALVLLHAILYQYRLSALPASAALEILTNAALSIQNTLEKASFPSSQALEHVFSAEDQAYFRLFTPVPISIVKWKYTGSVRTSVEALSGLCLTCSCRDKDHVLAGIRTMAVLRTEGEEVRADLACQVVLYKGDLEAEDIPEGLLVLMTGVVKGRERLLGRSLICFESIKTPTLEVSFV